MKVCYTLEKTKFNGKDYTFANYFLVFDNGRYIQIKPSFKKDYNTLKVVAVPMESK